MVDNLELFGQWTNNLNFKKQLSDFVFDDIMKRNEEQKQSTI